MKNYLVSIKKIIRVGIITSIVCVSYTVSSQEPNTFPNVGNVGIGTEEPGAELEVRGERNPNIKLSASEEGGYFQIGFSTSAGSYNYFAKPGDAVQRVLGGGNLIFAIPQEESERKISFNTSREEVLTVTGYGYVGIGNDTPNEKLDVNGNISLSGDIIGDSSGHNRVLQSAASLNGGAYIRLYDDLHGTNPGDLSIVSGDTGDIRFLSYTGGTWNQHMQIEPDGTVGIGTTNTPATLGTSNLSAYTLYVAGGILSEEIRVRTDWADYVFKEDYELKSLDQVEKYIAEHGHLPNVPSAETVAQEGIELGDISRIQQEKIEELTLYIIQLGKRIKALESNPSK